MDDVRRLILPLVLVAASATPCRADRLYLKNGQVKIGKVVKKDDDHVDFRITVEQSKISLVKRFPAIDVVRIEYDQTTETPPAHPPPTTIAERPSATQEASGSEKAIDDKPAFLKAALAEINDNKLDKAVRDLTRLVTACRDDPEELKELSKLCQDECGQPLDQLLASKRLQAALDGSSSKLGRFTPTKFERNAMVLELRKVIEEYCAKRVGGTSIDAELGAPNRYDADPEDAREFAKHITKTIDLVKELKGLSPSTPSRGKTGAARPDSEPRRSARGRRNDTRDRGNDVGQDRRPPSDDQPREPVDSRRGERRTDRQDEPDASDKPSRDALGHADAPRNAKAGLEDPGAFLRRLQELLKIVQRAARGHGPTRDRAEPSDKAERRPRGGDPDSDLRDQRDLKRSGRGPLRRGGADFDGERVDDRRGDRRDQPDEGDQDEPRRP